MPERTRNQVRRHGGLDDGLYSRLDHLDSSSIGVFLLYLLSSRSEPPIGGSLASNGRRLLAEGCTDSQYTFIMDKGWRVLTEIRRLEIGGRIYFDDLMLTRTGLWCLGIIRRLWYVMYNGRRSRRLGRGENAVLLLGKLEIK